jgi:hypothetical protein
MIEIDLRGIVDLERYFGRLPEVATNSARFAVNAAALRGAALGSREIRRQLNFPGGYLGAVGKPGSRLAVTERASTNNLRATITGRGRATSLARFALGAPRFGRPTSAPKVKVRAGGGASAVRGGFFVKLRAGNTIGENFNVGLAVRLKPGERIKNKRKMVSFGKGAYLLYGPSVDQAFRSVSADIQPQVTEIATTEFLRQFARLSRG